MKVDVAVGFDNDTLRDEAECLARQWHFPVDNQHLPRLCVTATQLLLLVEGYSPLQIAFDSVTIKRRGQAGRAQGLVRACRPASGLRVVDATAGFGRDAAVLAAMGAEVVMVERQPVMCAMLTDALARLSPENALSTRLSLVCAETGTYLQQLNLEQYPDVIYIDPMHPLRQKSALVKKEMQVLQQLIGPDDGALALLQQALQCVRQRVVVKWPQRLAPLIEPNYSIHGKTVRFDVYLSKG